MGKYRKPKSKNYEGRIKRSGIYIELHREMEYWRERAKKLADDKIELRNLLSIEILKDIDEVLEKNKEVLLHGWKDN